jgi:hypothetical protein
MEIFAFLAIAVQIVVVARANRSWAVIGPGVGESGPKAALGPKGSR